MNTKNVKPRWALAAVLGSFLVIGAVFGVVYHDVGIFYFSLAAAAVGALIIPVFLFIIFVLSSYAGAGFAGLFVTHKAKSEWVKKVARMGMP